MWRVLLFVSMMVVAGCRQSQVEPSPVCGDGTVDTGEGCDDGNTSDGDGCSKSCVEEFCGDGIQQSNLGEECDDGNSDDGDGCAPSCLLAPYCGDTGVNEGMGEECDDGNDDSNDGCDSTCQLEYCGDGVVQDGLGEGCDDENADDGDGCSAACQVEYCGDGITQEGLGEGCDDGDGDDGDGCSSACVLEFCGDGITQEGLGEGCDDENANDGDGCSSACDIEFCGDGITQEGLGEGCDDGDGDDGDGCSASCRPEYCGDGVVQEGLGESCDDENSQDNDGCDSNCTLPSCNNGIYNPGEVCYGQKVVNTPVDSLPQGVATGDLNGDGWLDLAVASYSGTLRTFLGDGSGAFQLLQTIETGLFLNFVLMSDLDLDGDLDLVQGESDASGLGSVGVFLNTGDGMLGERSGISVGYAVSDVDVFPLNADGYPELIVSCKNQDGGSVYVLYSNGDGTFAPVPALSVPGILNTLEGDVNNDGRADLVGLLGYGSGIAVRLQNATGGFDDALLDPFAGQPRGGILEDITGDGNLDIALQAEETDMLYVRKGLGNGTFEAFFSAEVESNPTSLNRVDLNQDSYPELLALAYNRATIQVFYGGANGSLSRGADVAAYVGLSDFAVADLDKSGRVDLIFSQQGLNMVTVSLDAP
jgi:cysteine-rich repeat protein